jgi:Ser/Thr protein kinase RdoA (MazF antagonist)
MSPPGKMSLSTRSIRGIGDCSDMTLLPHGSNTADRMVGGLRWVREFTKRRRFAPEARTLVEQILRATAPIEGLPSPNTWTINQILSTTEDAGVISLRSAGGGTVVAVMKLSRGPLAADSMRLENEVLEQLHRDARLADFRRLLPVLLKRGELAGHTYLLMSALPGVDARRVVSDRSARERMQKAVAAAIGTLHRETARQVVVDDTLADRWISRPVARISTLGVRRVAGRGDGPLRRRERQLRAALLGRSLTVSRIHGDLSPGNIRVLPDGSVVTGILDWETSADDHLPVLDVIQLLLATRVERGLGELGDVLRPLLKGECLKTAELELIERARAGPEAEAVTIPDLLVLAWLRHVAENLARSSDLYRHRWWIRRNIDNVVECL